MANVTMTIEALIATVVRAFYDDLAICLADVLIRDKFLRDDDMSDRLSLPKKVLRKKLQFLIDEHLVRSEFVDDSKDGGSQRTKFYYLDYCRAFHSIRLRLFLMKKELEESVVEAQTNYHYVCPGWKERRCNGRYSEEEAQQIIDPTSGFFLCYECVSLFENDPNKPAATSYTLQVEDRSQDVQRAVDTSRRFKAQLTKIFTMINKIQDKKSQISSNLPSENYQLGLGSKRLAGTGLIAKRRKTACICSKSDHEKSTSIFFNAYGQTVELSSLNLGAHSMEARRLVSKQHRKEIIKSAAIRVRTDLPPHLQVNKNKTCDDGAFEETQLSNKRRKLSELPYFLKDNAVRHGYKDFIQFHSESSTVVSDDNGKVKDDCKETILFPIPNSELSEFAIEFPKELEKQEGIRKMPNIFNSCSSALTEELQTTFAWEEGAYVEF